jgi:hypothetical protein
MAAGFLLPPHLSGGSKACTTVRMAATTPGRPVSGRVGVAGGHRGVDGLEDIDRRRPQPRPQRHACHVVSRDEQRFLVGRQRRQAEHLRQERHRAGVVTTVVAHASRVRHGQHPADLVAGGILSFADDLRPSRVNSTDRPSSRKASRLSQEPDSPWAAASPVVGVIYE